MCDLISVIIPVYNAGGYLRSAIDSVLTQNVNLELILIDDGSTDDSGVVCDISASKDDRIRVFHTENYGVSHARNIGLNHAKGQFITFLDADDELLSGALHRLLTLLLEYNADMAAGKKLTITHSGEENHMSFPQNIELWNGTDGLKNALADHPATYSVWGKLYRADLVRAVRFAEGRKVHEDSFFVFACMLNEPRVIVIDEEVIRYNLSVNSASRSAITEKHQDILWFAQKKHELTAARYPDLLPLATNMMLKAHLALLNNLSKTFDMQFREQERASLKYVCDHRTSFIPMSDNDQKLFDIVTGGKYTVWKLLKKHFKYKK